MLTVLSVLRQDTQDTRGQPPNTPKTTLMEISIAEAAKTLKVGRSTIYKKIEAGELSRSHSGKVDTSELFRVFGSSPKTPKTHQDTTPKTLVDKSQDTFKTPQDTGNKPDLSAQIAHLQAENTQLRERLTETREQARENQAKAEEREQWQRGQMERLTDTIKLLEAPRTATPSPLARWWKSIF